MRIAVTGGAGFVGSTIVRRLVKEGHHVRVVDDLSKGRASNLEDVKCDFHKADAGDVDYGHADAIVHAAAYPDVSANWKHPEERERQWRSNADLTRRLLDRTPMGATFVLLSTCSVYGPGEVHEFCPPRATSPYAASKIAAEALVQAYHEAKRLVGSSLRLVNVVGPRYGHGHLADFVRAASEGHIHALDNGHKRKSFVHVDDVAQAVVDALVFYRHLRNVTSEVQWSWRDSVAVMRAMRPEKTFTLDCESRASGWIGDPDELVVRTRYGYGKGSIVDGVRQALEGLGW